MKYTVYLKEHAVWAGIFLWLIFSIETFLLTLKGGVWLMLYTGLVLAAAFFVGTYAEYRREKAYLLTLYRFAENLEKKYLLPEMMTPGKRQEEKLLYELFCSVGKSMYEQVANHKRTGREYKEYIEMWIHEVKVPIAAARLILANRTAQDEGISGEVDRIEGYVEQALFYARSAEVEKDYFIKQVSLQKAVEEVLLQKKKELLQAHAVIRLHDLDSVVYSDGKWLSFLLGQVVGNSIKYAGGEGLTLEIYGREEQNGTVLTITDNGIGIKREELSRVFDKGFTGTNGRCYRKSTGIGLYLCQKLCGRLGHGIVISSEEGEGTTVMFTFPKSRFVDEVR